MPHKSLTQLGVERFRPGPEEVVTWDTNLPGFGVRVSPKGRKSFLVQYRVRGATGGKWLERQVVLGTLNIMSVAEARDKARHYKVQAAEGIDPVAMFKSAKQAEAEQQTSDAMTLTKLVDRYDAEYLVTRKPSGRIERMRLLKRWLTVLGKKPVAEITEADILAFINDILKGRSKGSI